MDFLRQIASFTMEGPPNKVLNVKASSYSDCGVQLRSEDNELLLYMPSRTHPKYEIVLQRPCSESVSDVFSLYRSENIESAQLKFLRLQDKIPILIQISQDQSIGLIQKICDTVDAHPSWNIAHIAVELNLLDCLQNPKVSGFFHCEDPHDGLSPLQLAVRLQNVRVIQLLINQGAPVDHFDLTNNSTLHYAALTNKKIVNMICNESKATINSKNIRGFTPFHIACEADKRECVAAFLEAGADVNANTNVAGPLRPGKPANIGDSLQLFPKKLHEDDIKSGGTPLHWAQTREMIEILIKHNIDLDCLNFDQRTALHMMVLRERLDCAVLLLCLGADMTLRDKDGLTPMRMAVQQQNLKMVKALIAFNGDVNELDEHGNTLRHGIPCGSSPADDVLYALHAVGSRRCTAGVRSCTVGCMATGTFNGVPPPTPFGLPHRDTLDLLLEEATPQRSDFSKGRLLSLDGGGIRGLIIIIVLSELEKAVGKPIIHCFDWVAGTSTGGILALALASGKSLQECLKLYFRLKDSVFVGMRPYSSEKFESILKESFGETRTMSDIEFPKLIIPATLMDRKPVDLHLFRNYASPEFILDLTHDTPFVVPKPPPLQPLWEAARATGAAPSYFSAKGQYVDGGLISNNPTLDAMTEIHEFNVAVTNVGRQQDATPLSLVVSIGTGIIPRVHNEGGLEVLRLETLWQPTKWISKIPALVGMLDVLVDQATQADGRVVDRARAWSSMLGIPYFRLSPQLSEDIPLDAVDNEKLVNMMWETRAYMHSRMPHLAELIEILRNFNRGSMHY